MKIVDTTRFKVLIILACIAAYGVIGRCDAIGAESVITLPPQMELQREYTPERSLIYHHFNCGDYGVPAWSILMRSNGQYIIGSPETVRTTPNFITLIYEEFPIEMFHYEPCKRIDHEGE